MTKRRFVTGEGPSDSFYEIDIHESFTKNTTKIWKVIAKWGFVGSLAGAQLEEKFFSWADAHSYFSKEITYRKARGYVEVNLNTARKEKNLPNKESEDIKLPRVWPKLRNSLLPGERAVYEKYDDGRTKQRRNSIATKWKALILPNIKSEETKTLNKVAWLFLRYTYLNYLSQVASYKPSVMETIRATVTQLQNQLNEVPDEQKERIDAELKKFTQTSRPLTLKECEAGVNALVDQLSLEIREKEKVGLGGLSRKRIKRTMRKGGRR